MICITCIPGGSDANQMRTMPSKKNLMSQSRYTINEGVKCAADGQHRTSRLGSFLTTTKRAPTCSVVFDSSLSVAFYQNRQRKRYNREIPIVTVIDHTKVKDFKKNDAWNTLN